MVDFDPSADHRNTRPSGGLAPLALISAAGTAVHLYVRQLLPSTATFAKYTWFSQQLEAGTDIHERLADVSPLYLALVRLIRWSGLAAADALPLLQIIAVGVAALLVGLAVRQIGNNVAACVATACVVATPAPFVNATELEPETLILLLNSAFFLTIAAATRSGGRFVLIGTSGVLLGLSAISRPTAIAAAAVVGCWLLLDAELGRRRFTLLAVFLGLFALAPAGVALWHQQAGRDALIMDPGSVFYEGMNPIATGYGGVQPRIVEETQETTGEPDALHVMYRRVASLSEGRELGRSEANHWWFRKAGRYAREYPREAAGLMLARIPMLLSSYESWDLVSLERRYRESRSLVPWLPFGVLAALAVVGIVPASRTRSGLLLIGLATVLALPMVAFYFSSRQRNSIIPFVAALAGLGAAWLIRTARAGQWRSFALAAGCAAIVAVVAGIETHRQREDSWGWSVALASADLSRQASAAADAGDDLAAKRLQTLAALGARRPRLADPSALQELTHALSAHPNPALRFDLARALTENGVALKDAETILLGLETDGYRPLRGGAAVDSIAWYLARIRIAEGDPAGARRYAGKAVSGSKGDEHVLALSAALGNPSSHRRLYSIHDRLTADLAMAGAWDMVGREDLARPLAGGVITALPRWWRARDAVLDLLTPEERQRVSAGPR